MLSVATSYVIIADDVYHRFTVVYIAILTAGTVIMMLLSFFVLLVCFAYLLRPPSTTVVSAEPFSHGTGTLRCLQKEMVTYRH